MTKAQYYQKKVREYMGLHGVTEFDPDDVARWLVDTNQYEEREYSKVRRCRQEITKALRQQHTDDPQGREVRAMLGARYKNAQGELFSKWSPTFEANPKHVRLSGQQWRRSIRGEVLLHDRTMRSYNDNNMHGAQIDLFDYNFNLDRDEDAMPSDYPEEKPHA